MACSHYPSPTKMTMPNMKRSSRIAATIAPDDTLVTDQEEEIIDPNIRALHQNWWPVTVTSAIQKDRPNAVELLGMRLVLFYDEDSGRWNCLEDMCAHRFAPLSEGRVVKSSCSADSKTCIQCAYHGWEFDTGGSCSHIPQREEGSIPGKVTPVTSYPVRSEVGMIWVWADPETAVFSQTIPLPISHLLRRFYKEHGDGSGFMRDLPYGMELLGENLLDLSHLPYSHHSVGGLKREIGGPLPLRMLSEAQKQVESELERAENSNGEHATVLPMFQVEVVNATSYDPILLSYAGIFPIQSNSTCTISYFDPCHVRYRRVLNGHGSHVELFMSPINAGRSRVILFNTAASMLPPVNSTEKEEMTFKEWISKLSPSELKAKVQLQIRKKLFNPKSARSHMISHRIFDGDGIFLNKQGDRMRRNGLNFKDYSTPTKADLLVNAFRRFLDKAAHQTEAVGHTLASSSVSSLGRRDKNSQHYIDLNDRPKLLERYESHTAHCPICSKELERTKAWQTRWNIVHSALVGASGSSMTFFTAAIGVSLLSTAIPRAIVQTSGVASFSTIVGAIIASRKKKKLAKKIQQFYFEDYVHAEKN